MLRKFLLGVSAAIVMSGTAHAAAFTNGSFELGNPQPAVNGFNNLGVGNTDITGWVVNSGSVDWINNYWEAFEGTHSVDLAGNEPGSIQQTFDTVVGTFYTVNYWVSGNPDGGPNPKSGVVTAINGVTTLAEANFYGPQGPTRDDMTYWSYKLGFRATDTSTTLRFASDPGFGYYGAALDNVTVTAAVPEPTTWAMMLVGFGVVGASMRRRAKRHPLQLA